MGIITTLFYIIGATLLTVASIFMFNSYLKSKNKATISLSLVFFFLGVHAYAFALPVVIDPDNLRLLGYGYITGVSFIFLTMLAGMGVQRFVAPRFFSDPVVFFVKTFIWLAWLTVAAIMFFDFRLPILEEGGVILWNVNEAAQWLIGLASLFYGTMWGVVFYNARKLVQNPQSKFKLLVISSDGFFMGIVALLVHTSETPFQTILGHILFVIAGTITLAIYIMPGESFSPEERRVA